MLSRRPYGIFTHVVDVVEGFGTGCDITLVALHQLVIQQSHCPSIAPGRDYPIEAVLYSDLKMLFKCREPWFAWKHLVSKRNYE